MKNKLSIKEMSIVGMCVAIMAIISQIAIPLPIGVPLTFQAFAVVIIAVILEEKLATLTMITFTLVGGIGVPIFANFRGGMSSLLGPTGGYIIGFIVMAWIVGFASRRNYRVLLLAGVYMGLAIDYAIGVMQLAKVAQLSWSAALAAGVYPFILKDCIAVAVGVYIAIKVKKRVRRQFLESLIIE